MFQKESLLWVGIEMTYLLNLWKIVITLKAGVKKNVKGFGGKKILQDILYLLIMVFILIKMKLLMRCLLNI